jgi:hypothetical protein
MVMVYNINSNLQCSGSGTAKAVAALAEIVRTT